MGRRTTDHGTTAVAAKLEDRSSKLGKGKEQRAKGGALNARDHGTTDAKLGAVSKGQRRVIVRTSSFYLLATISDIFSQLVGNVS
jgi:hypothetical protein